MKKKFLVTLCTVLCLASTTSVFAKDYTAPTDNAEVPIDFSMDSLFTVTLPENIQGKATKEVNFNYSVEGNIASNELVTVKPENSTFILSDITSKTIDANVSIPKTDFKYTEITTKNTQEGTVSVVNLPAGKWDGICKFLINLDTLPIEKAAGMYDADGNMLCALTAEQVEAKYTKDNNLPTTLGIDKTQVTEVVIPEGTTSIGESAFYDCLNLTSVTVPDSISSIKGFVFENTPWLASKRAENPLVIVNDILIDGKTASGDITIPSNVKTITSYAFRDCISLTSVTIFDNVTSIGYESFAGCTNLVSITMSNNISTIGSRAFYDCASLNNVILPDNITTIENSVFYGCSELNSIVIPNSVTSISGWAFCNCTNLTLTIPDSVSSIGTSAFSGVPHIYYNGTATGQPWGAKAIN